MGDRVLRNVCLVLFVVQCVCTLRYIVDIALGGTTEWWQVITAAFVSFALFCLYYKYRKKVKKG